MSTQWTPELSAQLDAMIASIQCGRFAAGACVDIRPLVAASDELKRLQSLVPVWRPIETAPRDGQIICVTGCNRFPTVLVAWFVARNESTDHDHWHGIVHRCCEDKEIGDPTHWMPLPESPC